MDKEQTETALVTSEQAQIGKLLPSLMCKIGDIAKKHRNNHQQYMFRSIDDVLNHVGPPAASIGIRVETYTTDYKNERVEWQEGQKFKFRVHVSLKMTLKFVAPDGSTHVCSAWGEGQDTSGDKATNKAMSGAYKYAMFMGLFIPIEGVLEEGDMQDTQECITNEQAKDICAKLNDAGGDMGKFLEYMGVDDVKHLYVSQYNTAIQSIQRKSKQ